MTGLSSWFSIRHRYVGLWAVVVVDPDDRLAVGPKALRAEAIEQGLEVPDDLDVELRRRAHRYERAVDQLNVLRAVQRQGQEIFKTPALMRREEPVRDGGHDEEPGRSARLFAKGRLVALSERDKELSVWSRPRCAGAGVRGHGRACHTVRISSIWARTCSLASSLGAPDISRSS